ncbi:FTR1 family protein [Priestia megaterium]
MKRKIHIYGFILFFLLSCFFLPLHQHAFAEKATSPDVDEVIKHVDKASAALKNKQLEVAKQESSSIKVWWNLNKQQVKNNSLTMATDVEKDIADLSLALVTERTSEASTHLKNLRQNLENYQDGAYVDNEGNTQLTLRTYILKMEQTQKLLQQKSWSEAQQNVQLLSSQWLSVEGDVVSQSQTVYNDSERDLLLLSSYVNTPSKQDQAEPLIGNMIKSLKPLAEAEYSMWDAALIPIREGMEAILVVGSLLTLSRKAKSKQASRWVIGGSIVGTVISIVLGILVVVLFTSSAFGTNNMLINGWSGVIASFLLLYVSYWLHKNSDIKRWNAYLDKKSQQAINKKKMVGFAVLACLAILREGLETVFFLIGMAGKMNVSQLVSGIGVGFGVLFIIAILMMKLGTKLPLRPFFLFSSIVVFYLCFKFMGSGIHSLQLATVLPSTVTDYLPSINWISFYPSWYSALPQLLFLLGAILMLLFSKLKKVETTHIKQKQTI